MWLREEEKALHGQKYKRLVGDAARCRAGDAEALPAISVLQVGRQRTANEDAGLGR